MYDTMKAHYNYEIVTILDRISELRRKLSNSKLFYSLKANHNPQVLKAIAQSNEFDAEVCSVGELKAAIDSGFNVIDIIYGGPGKTYTDFSTAIEAGVKLFSLESLHEVKTLKIVERDFNCRTKKILRVAPDSISHSKLSMAGPISKFGLSLEEIENLDSCTRSEIYGLHIYYGSQSTEYDCFTKHVSQIREIVTGLSSILPNIEFVNYGGGLNWPYLVEGNQRIQDYSRPDILDSYSSAFEFGRYVVASSGTLHTNVLDVKERSGMQVVILESGLHHLAGIAATGRILRSKLTVNVSNRAVGAEEDFFPTALYGPLCTPLDYLDLSASLPRLEVGDKLNIPNAGAYAFATRMPSFLLREGVHEYAK